MQNPLSSPASSSLGLLLARVPLGAILVVDGFKKFMGPGGISGYVERTAELVPGYVPEALGGFFLRAGPFVEILAGAMLVLGVLARAGGLAGAVVLAGAMLAVTGLHGRDGGGMLVLQPNLVFLGVALLVFFAGPGGISMDRVMWPKPVQNRGL